MHRIYLAKCFLVKRLDVKVDTAQDLQAHSHNDGACGIMSRMPCNSAQFTEKYLFLDFDGPLHPSTTLQGKNVGLIASNPTALRDAGFFVWADALEEVLLQAEASQPVRINVIVNSSWRAQAWYSPPVIRQALGALGERICGFTRSDLPRAQAVHDLCERMGIEDYLVIDDDIRAFEGHDDIQQHLLAVNPLRGVREPQVSSALLQWAAAEVPRPCGCLTPSSLG